MMRSIKTLIGKVASAPPTILLYRRYTRRCATIFMSHRFESPCAGFGSQGAQLRWALAYLRRHRFNLVSVEHITAAYLEDPKALTRAVAFTVDDGYEDFAAVAAPIFAEFDCPVTVFLPTGFIDRTTWMWWDRILYAFEETTLRAVDVPEFGLSCHLSWESVESAAVVASCVAEEAKHLTPEQRDSLIDKLHDQLGVEQPENLPERFSPMTWPTIRRLESTGVRFGPHTVTHPLLSQLGDPDARWEMEHSWARLRAELVDPAPIFCYPNGTTNDVLPRDLRVAEEIGMRAGLSTAPFHVVPGAPELRYFLPRFGLPEENWRVRAAVEGLERAKALMRGQRKVAPFPSPVMETCDPLL